MNRIRMRELDIVGEVRLGFRDNADAQPFEASVVYVVTYPAGREPDMPGSPGRASSSWAEILRTRS
jgi:hypothetical protein